MRRLIVTADDLGAGCDVDTGVIEACDHGPVTSVSLLVTGPTAGHAARAVAQRPELSVGLHLSFVKNPLLTAAPSLLLRGRPAPHVFALSVLRPRANDLDLEAEAQLERFTELTGQAPDFVNTEQHAQLLPHVLRAVVDLCVGHEIRFTRSAAHMTELRLNRRPRSWLWPAATLVDLVERRTLERARIAHPDTMLGGPESGRLTASALDRLLEQPWRGTAELVVHPRVHSAELQALTRGHLGSALADAGIRRIPFREL